MKALILGATGATGRLLAVQLERLGVEIRALVRSPDKMPAELKNLRHATLIAGSILELGEGELIELVRDCDAVALCLGHTISFRGVFGHPRMLVRDAVRRLCGAIVSLKPKSPVRFVLMNTVGVVNRDILEKVTWRDHLMLALVRCLLPPHRDNEEAANYLRTGIGQTHPAIEWVVVRPEGLIDRTETTPYETRPSPIRSAFFDSGSTSRINVGHFMAGLITDAALWQRWKGKMPVISDVSSGNQNE